MLAWLWRRSRAGGVNRQGRRALSRLARLPRGETDRIVHRLRRLSEQDRDRVLARLPAWQADPLRSQLRRPAP